jgi:site-specific recombinase XerD
VNHAREKTRFPPEILTRGEVQRLIAACPVQASTGVRNRSLIVTLYRAGLRVSEALDLMPKDLDPEAGTVRVLNGKGAKARTVGLDPLAFSVVEAWLEHRSKLGFTRVHSLFCTLAGTRMSSSYVRAVLPRLAAKAGIQKRVHAHGFRHTHAAELAAEGIPMNIIQRQLGHSNLGTTSRYLDHLRPQEVIEAIQKREWSL